MRVNGDVLREVREIKGLSERETARRAGLSAAFVSDIERGRRNPSKGSLRAICRVLAVYQRYVLLPTDAQKIKDFVKVANLALAYIEETPTDDLLRRAVLEMELKAAIAKAAK